MRRRDLLAGLGAATVAGAGSPAAALAFRASGAGAIVRRRARGLAARDYRPPNHPLPPQLADLSYDAYRDLRFRADKAVWRDQGLPFQLQMFHRGGFFRDPVEIFEVAQGAARPIAYSPDFYDFGPRTLGPLGPDLGFAGFRIHAPINGPYYDEVAVFLGASYFRAVPRGGLYGLSARGLALGAGEDGEEFPAFRAFYIERPAAGAASITVHALLDSPSVAGAWRFVITPGEVTRFDVSASLFPRVRLTRAGIAPLTSMYLFGAEQPRRFDDFRPQVHDSDGLLVANGRGERLWRPLTNPARAQTSAFLDEAPRGFGLMQRRRDFAVYQDLEANYHRRPGLWVEPVSGFGQGDVRLAELPAASEAEDNIVASWRPGQPLEPGREHRFEYRMHWAADPAPPSGLARVVQWRDGHGDSSSRRRFVLDFAPVGDIEGLRAEVSASAGGIRHINVQPNAYLGGARLSFELEPGAAPVSELRAALVRGRSIVSEAWVHRWLS